MPGTGDCHRMEEGARAGWMPNATPAVRQGRKATSLFGQDSRAAYRERTKPTETFGESRLYLVHSFELVT